MLDPARNTIRPWYDRDADGTARVPPPSCPTYFGGPVPYVKTMIRERGDRGYHAASAAYHAVAVVLATVLSPWLAAPFGWFLVRAVVLPWRRLPIMTVGLIEVANSVLVLGFLAALR